MAELATIARPYAEALFQSAKADLNGALTWVEELAAIAADPGLQQFAGNPRTTSQQVYDLSPTAHREAETAKAHRG